jgi:hypothetical protein
MRFIMGVEDLRSASLPAARGVVLFLESAGIRQRRAPPLPAGRALQSVQ